MNTALDFSPRRHVEGPGRGAEVKEIINPRGFKKNGVEGAQISAWSVVQT